MFVLFINRIFWNLNNTGNFSWHKKIPLLVIYVFLLFFHNSKNLDTEFDYNANSFVFSGVGKGGQWWYT